MNKFIRGCLYVTGIVAAIGLVFFIIGAMFGGVQQVIRIGQSGGFHCASFTPDGLHISVDTDGIDVGDIDVWDVEEGDFDEDIDEDDLIDYTEDEIGTKDDIDSVDIHIGAGELYIRESEDVQYHVEADHTYNLKCYETDGVLHISSRGLSADSRKFIKQRVFLYIPKGESLEDLDILLGAGTGRIENIESEELTMEVGAGELKGEGIRAASAGIEVGAGAAELRDCNFEDVDYNVGLGSLYCQGSIEGDAEISCSMGSVELNLNGTEDDFDYRINCSMGSVIAGKRQFAGVSGDKRIENDADKMMNIDCAMGTIAVKFN